MRQRKQITVAASNKILNKSATKVWYEKISFLGTREKITNCEVKLQYCGSEDMIADISTKPLGRVKHKRIRDLMSVTNEHKLQ